MPTSSSGSAHHELRTASRYYALYKLELPPMAADESAPGEGRPVCRSSRPNGATEVASGDDDDEARRSFWEDDDDWTEERAAEAATKLSDALSECDIATSAGEDAIRRYEAEAEKNWDRFYKHNGTNFFKDRHYLHKTFPEDFGPLFDDERGVFGSKTTHDGSVGAVTGDDGTFTVVEIGCGVGNTVLPLLERSQELISSGGRPRLRVWGFDFSSAAIRLLRKDARFVEASADGRARAGVWDITTRPPEHLNAHGVADVSVLLFCLSAIGPDKMGEAAKNVAATLKPGGRLVFRDYGRYDETQLKLGTSKYKRLGENFYVKHDGTRCYYFDLDDLRRLFGKEQGGAGLDVVDLKYIRRVYNNRKTDVSRYRVWVQGRFRKPVKLDSTDL